MNSMRKVVIFLSIILLCTRSGDGAAPKRGPKKGPKEKKVKEEVKVEKKPPAARRQKQQQSEQIEEPIRSRISIPNREKVCEGDTIGSCTMTKNLGDRVDLKIGIRGAFTPQDLTWYRRVKVYEEPNLQTIPLLKNGRPPDNMYVSNNRSYVVILHLRDYDVSSNSFKVVLNDGETPAEQVFVIELEPIGTGIKHVGDDVEITIDKYLTLPTYAAYLYWYMEGKSELPTNAEISQNGHVLKISNLQEENYGIFTCAIYSTQKYFVAKRRFRVSREVTIYPLSPVYPREIFRPVGSSVSFAVRIIGDYKPENIKWYKGLTKVDLDRTDIMVSDDGRNLTVLNLKKSDYGSYICTLKDEETQETRAKTDFQLSQPVFDHYGDIAHYWDFEMMQHREESHVEFLDTISHKKSTGTCARSSEGLVGNSLYLNMKRKRCNGFFTLYKDTYADECLTEPDNCIDGLSLSLWLNPNSATGDDFVYLVCGEPRGLCLKGKYNEAKGHFTISVSLTTTERRWKVDGLRIVIEEWQNIVVSWDPIGEMRVYLNSELKGSQFAEEKAQPRVAGEQHIAYLGKGPGEEKDISYINGLYDELVIWYQRVISAKETSTMFLQVRGMGPYPEDESTYEFEIAEGESATFHCPYQIPLLFRSHLNWVRDDHILPELRGRSDVRVIGDTMLSMTCQYFSGARLVISDPFKIKFPGKFCLFICLFIH
ncbi:uncharacterized protein [Ptychodera flava]|uniref:uncharacterized protein n=1 Tax=Ptychodera flava TaxID=63121 RepID=UPI00396A15FE